MLAGVLEIDFLINSKKSLCSADEKIALKNWLAVWKAANGLDGHLPREGVTVTGNIRRRGI